MSLQRFDQDGLELVINTNTGESFATISGYARMAGLGQPAITKRLKKGDYQNLMKTAKIQTGGGMQGHSLIPESIIADWIVKDNPKLASKMLLAGVRLYLHGAAGFQYQVKSAPRKKSLTPAVKSVFPSLLPLLREVSYHSDNPSLQERRKVREWLNNCNPTRGELISIGHGAASTFRLFTGEDPLKTKGAFVYPEFFLPVLEDLFSRARTT